MVVHFFFLFGTVVGFLGICMGLLLFRFYIWYSFRVLGNLFWVYGLFRFLLHMVQFMVSGNFGWVYGYCSGPWANRFYHGTPWVDGDRLCGGGYHIRGV